MPSARSDLRGVAVIYAFLGVLTFGIVAVLVELAWWDSTSHLWFDLGRYAGSVAWFAAAGFGLLILAGLSLRYLSLSHRWRTATLAASLLVALWQITVAVIFTAFSVGASRETASASLWTQGGIKWGVAFCYSLCSYGLWKHRGLLTNAGGVREPQ